MKEATILLKFANTREKLFMSVNEAIVLSQEIVRRISTLPNRPKIIICIGGGAILMSKVVSSSLGIPMKTIWIQRKGTIIKEKLSIIPGLNALISQWHQIPVLNIPLKYMMNKFSYLSTASQQLTPEVQGRYVLILDDAIETGQTLIRATKIVHTSKARSIKTAALAWSDRSDLNQEDRIQPDIFIGGRVQHFPWSKNSPYRLDYEKWCKPNLRCESYVVEQEQQTFTS